ncbi:MAG: polyphosphate kinase 1 [Tenuifilaceae bacterium]
MSKKKELINRELSWLSFNDRVLQEAADDSVPLIERLKFLGIFSNNMDEFFRIRVATIHRLLDFEKGAKKLIGEKPKKILEKIQKYVICEQDKFDAIYEKILKKLAKENIILINEKELNNTHAEYIRTLYKEEISTLLSPIMLNSITKFPELTDRSIYLAVKLSKKIDPSKHEYALIEVPTSQFSRFIKLPEIDNKKIIILLEDAIRFCLDEVFNIFSYDNYEAWIIKITRDAELDVDNDISESMLEKISKGVKNRHKGEPVRFVYDSKIAPDLLKYFIKKLNLDDEDTLIPGGRYHNFKDFMSFPRVGNPKLLYEPLKPARKPELENTKSIISVVAKKDFLLHHPYHSFSYYIKMLREAAIDPKVDSIKITIYRVASESKVVRALINAAQNGKKVTAVVELRARFDEKSNINWSHLMQEAGINVIFGVPVLKVHGKMTLITRIENKKPVNYTVLSTGNFHEGNASLYTDINLFTADKRITNEVEKVFTFLEFNYRTFTYKHLLVSPASMRRKIYTLIDKEIENAKHKKPAYILCKINNLVDEEIIHKLYQASKAGVSIKLVIRGICSLVPGIPGQSENIEVVSIIDRLLEHSRIFIFCNNGDEKYFISSADWMTRNLDYRIEVAAPVYDETNKKELKRIIEFALKDNIKARIVNPNQDNTFKKYDSKNPFRSQMELSNYYLGIEKLEIEKDKV